MAHKIFHAIVSQNTMAVCSAIFFLLLAGCQSSALYHQTETNIADVVEHGKAAIRKSDLSAKIQPAVVINEGLYVDKTPINIAKSPHWLKSHIIIRGDDLPFSYYSRTIVMDGGRNILTRYQVGLDPNIKISMNYSGTVQGALDLLATKAGFIYNVNGNNIYWQAFVTKTFDIAFMPGASDYMMGKSSSGGSISSAGGTGSQMVTAIIDDSAAAQYSNLKGSLSVWKDLEHTIRQLLSPEGKVIVSEATTTITVRDKPTNIDLVSKFIENFNHNLSKQVLIKVQVLDITLASLYNYGINWQAVKTMLGTQFRLSADESTPISLSTLPAPLNLPNGAPFFGANSTNYPNGNTTAQVLITALTAQGKVSIVTEPRVVCLNNQVSVIRIVNQNGYLASIQNTTVPGSTGTTGSTITSQITPGSLTTGFTLYVLPKILGNKIYLQVNADLSVNNGFKNISSTQGQVANNSTPANSNSQIIQVPNVTQKQFNQRSIINSGDTLILSGFKQVTNQANAMQLFDSQALGGRGAEQQNIETIVLITPIILNGTA